MQKQILLLHDNHRFLSYCLKLHHQPTFKAFSSGGIASYVRSEISDTRMKLLCGWLDLLLSVYLKPSVVLIYCTHLTLTATLISMFHKKSVEKSESYRRLKNSIWPTFSCQFKYFISFQNFNNCLILSYLYHHIICVSDGMQFFKMFY